MFFNVCVYYISGYCYCQQYFYPFIINNIKYANKYLMPTLHFYGCSYGLYGTSDGSQPDAHTWGTENSIPYFLAKHLNVQLSNHSWAGSCNYQLFNNIMSTPPDKLPNDDDITIVQWAHIGKVHTNHNAPLWLEDSLVKNTSKDIEIKWYKNMTIEKMANMIDVYKESFFDPIQESYRILTYNSYLKSKIRGQFYYALCDRLHVFDPLPIQSRNELLYDKHLLQPSVNYLTMTNFIDNEHNLRRSCWHPTMEGCDYIARNYARQILEKQNDF